MARTKKTKEEKISDAAKLEAIAIVDRERNQWEDAVCYVTEKVGFQMRQLIRTLRKNYWGVFDEPIDPVTQREKTWIPLAMKVAEDYVKNINMSLKDVNFRASNSKGYALTDLTRGATREYLQRMSFGEIMDETDRQLCIDGTVVWKTWESKDAKGKPKLNRRTVDLLNFYIDPTEQDIQSAYRVTERALLLPSQIEGMTGWTDTEDIKGSNNLDRNDGRRKAGGVNRTTGEFVDVWEMYGKGPKWLVTKDRDAEDALEEIDLHIVVSGLDSSGTRCHLIEENKKKDKFGNIIKPYEELRDTKVSGRWYGVGRIERILALVEWLNTIDNIRINRSYVSQLGLFKIKKGSGITPQMLARLPVNGAVPVQNMEDIQQLVTTEPGVTAYKDEDIIKDWAVSITSAYPIASGDSVPASQTATTSAIQNTNSKSAFQLSKEAKGMFMQRWIDRHALPIIAKTLDAGDIVRFTVDDEGFHDLVERVVSVQATEALENHFYTYGVIPTPQEFQDAINRAETELKKGNQVFVEMVDKLVAEHVDTIVYFTNEDLDTSVTVQNLIQMLQLAPENRKDIIKQIYDLLGLQQPREQMPQAMPQQAMASQPPQAQQRPNLQNITQGSLVPNQMGGFPVGTPQ